MEIILLLRFFKNKIAFLIKFIYMYIYVYIHICMYVNAYIYICKILRYGGLFGRKFRKYRYVERGKQSPRLLGSLYPRVGACSLF